MNRNVLRVFLALGIAIAVVGGLLLVQAPAEKVDSESPVAAKQEVPEVLSLRDMMGNGRPLHDFDGHNALVVCFLGTECPISNVYIPGLLRMNEEFRDKGVQFLAAYPNASDDLDAAAAHAYERNIPFPVLKDFDQQLAKTLGVKRVPTVCVLDEDFVLQYRGRIDDQYSVSTRKPRVARQDLLKALEEVVAGNDVSVAETSVDGCLLDLRDNEPTRKDVTYAKDVASIIQENCQKCHRPEMAGPFQLMDYQDAADYSEMIREVVLQRRMPPWHADPEYGEFHNSRRLTQKEINTIVSWIDIGMPMGDPDDLPEPKDWVEGWTIGEPDVVFDMPEEHKVPADGVLPYEYFIVDPGFTEDKWVRAAEARPGSEAREVVHHIIVYMSQTDRLEDAFDIDGNVQILVGYAPGDLPLTCPPGTAMKIPKGSKLIFELHYTPNGIPATDRSDVGIKFAEGPPEREFLINGFGNNFIKIPPHTPHHSETATFTFPEAARILGFMPHMHWRGKAYHYEALYPDGEKEVLLSVPRYDFNWQTYYWFEEPVHVPEGTKIRSVAHWDNSANNLYNPDPSATVEFGLQTADEMMLGWMNYVWERPGAGSEVLTQAEGDPAGIFEQADRNGNGVIDPDELDHNFKRAFEQAKIDTTKPIPEPVFAKFLQAMRQARLERLQAIRDGKIPSNGRGDGRLERQRRGDRDAESNDDQQTKPEDSDDTKQ